MADLISSLVKELASTSPNNIVPTAPGAAPKGPNAAIKRCCAAWRRAYNAHMRAHGDDYFGESDAEQEGAKAYRNAMPLLTGQDGISDFIACAAYGILIDVIPQEKSGSLLYAAQVAMSSLSRLPKETDRARQKRTPTPSPGKTPEPEAPAHE